MSSIDKQIHLHIGTPKTGTSALQKFLVENRSELEKRGFSYPAHALGEYDISSGNGQEIVNLGVSHGAGKARSYMQSLIKESKSRNVLISTEAFYGYPELIHQVIPSAKIIVYFRNQLDLVESSYNQAVKRGGQKAPFSRALRSVIKTKKAFHTGELILQWVKLFGVENVIFRVYENESFKNQNIYDDFLDALGISDTRGFQQPSDKINVSYCLDALDYKRCLNALTEGYRFPYMKEVDTVLQAYSHDYFKSGGRKFSLYSREELKEADQFFESYRLELSNTFGLERGLFINSYELRSCILNGQERVSAIERITDLLLTREPRIEKILASCLAKGLRSESASVRAAAQELTPLFARPKFYAANYEELSSENYAALWFTDRQLSMMKNGNYREPDFLRDIAVLAGHRKHTKLAHDLISRALELRPNGPKIIELEQYFREKLEE